MPKATLAATVNSTLGIDQAPKSAGDVSTQPYRYSQDDITQSTTDLNAVHDNLEESIDDESASGTSIEEPNSKKRKRASNHKDLNASDVNSSSDEAATSTDEDENSDDDVDVHVPKKQKRYKRKLYGSVPKTINTVAEAKILFFQRNPNNNWVIDKTGMPTTEAMWKPYRDEFIEALLDNRFQEKYRTITDTNCNKGYVAFYRGSKWNKEEIKARAIEIFEEFKQWLRDGPSLSRYDDPTWNVKVNKRIARDIRKTKRGPAKYWGTDPHTGEPGWASVAVHSLHDMPLLIRMKLINTAVRTSDLIKGDCMDSTKKLQYLFWGPESAVGTKLLYAAGNKPRTVAGKDEKSKAAAASTASVLAANDTADAAAANMPSPALTPGSEGIETLEEQVSATSRVKPMLKVILSREGIHERALARARMSLRKVDVADIKDYSSAYFPVIAPVYLVNALANLRRMAAWHVPTSLGPQEYQTGNELLPQDSTVCAEDDREPRAPTVPSMYLPSQLPHQDYGMPGGTTLPLLGSPYAGNNVVHTSSGNNWWNDAASANATAGHRAQVAMSFGVGQLHSSTGHSVATLSTLGDGYDEEMADIFSLPENII